MTGFFSFERGLRSDERCKAFVRHGSAKGGGSAHVILGFFCRSSANDITTQEARFVTDQIRVHEVAMQVSPRSYAPPRPAPAPAPADNTATMYDGSWTLSLSTSGYSRACSKPAPIALIVTNSYARTSVGPVFVNRTGTVSGTLTLNDGSGITTQVTLSGMVAGRAGLGQLSGGCSGTFMLSR